jgi:hypothetical protein
VKRRHFLVGGAAALVLGPAWLRRAFGDATVRVSAPDHARATLVLIIPAKDEERDARGHALGAYLNHASDAQLAPLAGVEVACATAAQVQKLVEQSSVGKPLIADPLLALVGLDHSVRWSSAKGLPPMKWNQDDEANESIERQIDFVAARVHELVGPAAGDARRLAAEVRARTVQKPPAGAHWARDSSCGFDDVEGMVDREADEKISMDCGMGHVPDKSARFLYFWNKTPARRALERNGG